MTDPKTDDEEEFDFKAECISFYRKAKSEAVRFKTLELISTLLPKKATVKPEDKPRSGDSPALAAQRRMNGGA